MHAHLRFPYTRLRFVSRTPTASHGLGIAPLVRTLLHHFPTLLRCRFYLDIYPGLYQGNWSPCFRRCLQHHYSPTHHMADGASPPSTSTRPSSTQPYGPFVTPFSAPSFCSIPVRSCDSDIDDLCEYMQSGQTCGSDGKPSFASECFPSGTQSFDSYLSTYNEILYSAATQCPDGWVDVGRSSFSSPSIYTKISCCPS